MPDQDHVLYTGRFEVRFDSDFPGVMAACATTPRNGQDGTWITPEMRHAYTRLHELGWAHSVETYADGVLVGGLYGMAIGRMFYGESMFSWRTDASKIALAALVARYRLPSDAAFGLFAISRSVGLLAHSMEQLAEPQVIRPRGRYIGAGSLPRS